MTEFAKRESLDKLSAPAHDSSAYEFDSNRNIKSFSPKGGPTYTFNRDQNGYLYSVSYKHEGANYSYQRNYNSNTWHQIKDGYYTGSTWDGNIEVDALNGYRLTSANDNPHKLSLFIKADGSRVTERYLGQTTLKGDENRRLTEVKYKGNYTAKISYADKESKTPSEVIVESALGEESLNFTYDKNSQAWRLTNQANNYQVSFDQDGTLIFTDGKETRTITTNGEFKIQSRGITRYQDLSSERILRVTSRNCELKFDYDSSGNIESVGIKRGLQTSTLKTKDFKDFKLNADGTYQYSDENGNTIAISIDLTETKFDKQGNFISATTPDGHQRRATYNEQGVLSSITEIDKKGKENTWSALGGQMLEGVFVPTSEIEKFSHINFDKQGRISDFNFVNGGKFSFEYSHNNRVVTTFNVHTKNGEIDSQYVREGNSTRWKVFKKDENSGELKETGGFATFEVCFTKDARCALRLSDGKYNVYDSEAKNSATNTPPEELKVRTDYFVNKDGSIIYTENGKSQTRALGRSIETLRETMLGIMEEEKFKDVERTKVFAKNFEERMRRQGLLMVKNGIKQGDTLAEEKVLKTYENLIEMMSEDSKVGQYFSKQDRIRLAIQAMKHLENPQSVRQGANTCNISVVEVGTIHLNPQNYTDVIKQITLEGKVKLRATNESKPGQILEKDISLELSSLSLKDWHPEKHYFVSNHHENHLRSWVSRIFQTSMINATRKFEGTHSYEFHDNGGENPNFMVHEIRRASEFLNGMKLPTINYGQTNYHNYQQALKNGLPVLALTANGEHIQTYVPHINENGVVTSASLDNTYHESNDQGAFSIEHVSHSQNDEHRLVAKI